MAQFFNDEPTGKILEPVRLLRGHLGVGELAPVFEEGGAQDLLGRETGSPLP